jgi:hypothetical protein
MGWVAIYYPVLFPGWVLTFFCLFFILYFYAFAAATTSTTSGMIYSFLPKVVIVFLVYDLACFRMGEYPYWWKLKDINIPNE